MRKKIFGLGLLAAGFMLTITLTGCPNGNDDNNIGGPENQGGLTGLLVTNAPVAAMQVGGTVNLGLTRTPADAPVPGGIHWETSPAIAGEWITLNNATINGVTVTAAAGTANVGAIANANAEGRVAVRATFGTGSGRVESPWVQIEVAAAPLLGSLSFQDVGAAIPVQPNSTRSLVLVLEPANAIPGDITWYPLQGDNPDVWVMPADNGLSATLHAGPNPTDGSVSVTASSDVVGSTAATVAVTVQAGASLVVFQQANVGPNATQAWPAPRGDGRFVIVNDTVATTGGINNNRGVTEGVFVSMYPPLDIADGDITFSARVRIAEDHNENPANDRGLMMGFFNAPTDFRPATGAGQQVWVDYNALAVTRISNNGNVTMQVTRAANQDTSAANFATGGISANPNLPNIGREFIVEMTRVGRITNYVVRDAGGTELATGIREGVDAQSTIINPVHVGFMVFSATVELSQISISQGDSVHFSTPETEPVAPPAEATGVTLAAEGPTTVATGTNVVVNATVLPGTLVNRDVTWTVDPPLAIVSYTGTSVTVTLDTAGEVTISAVTSAAPNVPTEEDLVITFDEEGTPRLPLGVDPWVFTGEAGTANAASAEIINQQLPEGISLTGNWRWRPGNDGLDPNGVGRTMVFSADFVNESATITLYVTGTHADNVINVERLAAYWDLPEADLTVTEPWNVGSAGRNTVTINVAARTAALILNWPWSASNGAVAPGRLSLMSIDRTTP